MMLLAQTGDWRTWVLMAGVLVVIFFLLRANRRRYMGRGGGATSGGGVRSTARAAQEIRDQLDQLMVELEQLARETNATIQTRSARLEVLLEQADQKIGRLGELVDRLDGRVNGPGGESAATESTPSPVPAAAEVKPEHRRVYDLADEGRTPVQIAADLGRDVGEVELILALRNKG